MKLYDILPDSDPILRLKCQNIITIDPELHKLIDDMIFTMNFNNGVGLAAPQIGKSINLFVMRIPGKPPQHFINPKVFKPLRGSQLMNEGCLSLRGQSFSVERPLDIIVETETLTGLKYRLPMTGLAARIFLHEFDHLSGVLISDIGTKVL